jgi:beta-glucosidase
MLDLDPADVALVASLRRNGLPVVVVLLTGAPVPLPPEVRAADAIVAAWLPGSEASGLADVLFGDRPFSGRLPHAWPRAPSAGTKGARKAGAHAAPADPREAGDPGSDPEYPLGFGLGG